MNTSLIEAARQGDRAALEQLLAASQPDLRRFARRSCATSEDADDAVQVALWSVQRNIGSLRVVAAFAGWLFRIVERECYRLLRLRRGMEPWTDELEAALPDDPLALRRDLAHALSALPREYRDVLVLRDVEELTAPEAASQLQITVAALKSRLHRARAMMRERLAAGGYTPQ
ncbi:RNA polymerase sigma factor SigM [Pseudoduganella ginsengisoli]|uniref:Sigma-70 family RNA polymerase sigma factor n=1 Tax=Pseudoduganella ginsengisoli TaxID=1462440 RepID=A0A6L6Q9X2_9BURK|nr:sigma-70 family RNA polymerase sigma factor [Pseudoduganella ginsengisoli]MTW06269.1 sigma-70 family RNA polymerase sigma factor [Pseudoduganella ginsengisoli]